MNHTIPIDQIWYNLLSRDELLIQKAFSSISFSEQDNIIHHLRKMAFAEGWNIEQAKSARIALEYLDQIDQQSEKE